MSWVDAEIGEDFKRARRKAFVENIRSFLYGHANELLPFEEIRTRLNAHNRRYLGLQKIPLDAIIGSEGRYSDFDRHFLPRRDSSRTRWMNIYRAHYNAVELPPVELYKISDIYFVKDGHHRISVARHQDQPYIEAYVTELEVNVPLHPDVSLRTLLLVEEYNDFLEWTSLHRLRPHQRICFSKPGGHLDLIRHINVHRYYLGQERNCEINREEAVAAWYDMVYMPVVQLIREQHILGHFPNRTEADLYRWIMDHRWHMRERNAGIDPGPQAATSDYTNLFGRKNLIGSIGEFLRNALGMRQPDSRE